MNRVLLAGLLALSGSAALAQEIPAAASLNDTQRAGQKIVFQHCGVCHLKPQITANQFGPSLSRESVGGQDDAMRMIINEGTQRMPGFKHMLSPDQVNLVIAYLKAIPAPPAAAAPAPAKAP